MRRPPPRSHAGDRIVLDGVVVCEAVPFTVLEGHRVAVLPVDKGEALLSWGMPFGHAEMDLKPGDYVCNYKVLAVLKQRRAVTWAYPSEPTFKDMLMPKAMLDPATFKPGKPTPSLPAGSKARTFEGFKRPGKLG